MDSRSPSKGSNLIIWLLSLALVLSSAGSVSLALASGPSQWLIVIAAFCIAGTATLLFSRFLLSGIMHLEGNMWSGPWSYRVAYLLLIPPFYSVTLLGIGTLFGEHAYFKRRVLRIWGRPFAWLLRRQLGVSSTN